MVLRDPVSAISHRRFLPSCKPTSNGHVKHRRSPPAVTVAAAGAEASGAEGGAAAAASRRSRSALETRVSLVAALASQAFSLSQRVLGEFLSESAKYAAPSRRFGEPRNLEEVLMSVPDLESVNFKVLKRTEKYEIREVESYFIAETIMPGKRGFDFNSSGQAFNVLAAYLFGKNTTSEQMEMTTPVFTRKTESEGERMEMTTPVITKKGRDEENWQMSFVMPSKYGRNLPSPVDSSVRIKEVPRKIVAVTAFSGLVTDEIVKQKELSLRDALRSESEFKVEDNALVEVAQFNPPFTLPFNRRNEVSLEVKKKDRCYATYGYDKQHSNQRRPPATAYNFH